MLFGEANLCAGLGHGIPIGRFFWSKPTAYSEDAIPTPPESENALAHLMVASDIRATHVITLHARKLTKLSLSKLAIVLSHKFADATFLISLLAFAFRQ